MAAGDSRSEALEWQPRFLRPKELRHGTESRCASGSGGYLHLALRAEKRASLPEPPGPDRGSADATGLAGAAVDVERELEVSGVAVTAAEIAQGGTAGPDSAVQCFTDGRDKPSVLGPVDAAGGTRGAQTP